MQSVALPDPRFSKATRVFWLAAVVCAVVPMFVAIIITFLYAVTERNAFIDAGIWWLLMGGTLVLLGFGFLAVCAYQKWQSEKPRFRAARYIVLALLLAANVPVAIVCITVGNWLATRVTVELINDTSDPIDLCVMEGPGLHASHSHILPGEKIRDHFFPDAGGSVNVTITQGASTQHLNGMGGHARVHIQPGGTSTIDQHSSAGLGPPPIQ